MQNIVIPEDLKELSMKKFSFFDDAFSIELPDYMNFMTEQERLRHFAGRMNPSVAMTSPHGDALLVLEKQELEEPEESIDSFIEKERLILSRLIPGYVEIGYGTKFISRTKVGCIQYKSNAIDKDMINIYFAFKSDNVISYGLFAAPFEWSDIWTKVFLSCIDTLHVTDSSYVR